MVSDLETMLLEQILLPPIPGALPSLFFTEIPLRSAAIFSTNLGTRPFRSLPSPVPVHVIRSGSDSDVREKSSYLFRKYPTIAESITTPPTAWQDLYQYFDATDLWMEGAGFLFHVLGHIVKINLTKLHYLEDYVKQFALINEARLIKMLPRQDMLSLFQTPYDHAWFDYDNMTLRDKGILNSTLQWHCEAFHAKHISASAQRQVEPLQAIMEREAQKIMIAMSQDAPGHVASEAQNVQAAVHSGTPDQAAVEARRSPQDMPADPYHHFGRTDHNIPLRLINRSSQPVAQYLDSGESQARTSYGRPYQHWDNIQSLANPLGSFYGQPHHQVPRKGPSITEAHCFPPNGYPRSNSGQRQHFRDANSHAYSRRQPLAPKEPVYILDPQKSILSLHKEAFGVEGGHYRMSPECPSQQLPNTGIQMRHSYDNQENSQYSNHIVTLPNDARLLYDERSITAHGSARPIRQDYLKHSSQKSSWPDSDFNKSYSIQVLGFSREVSSGYPLEKLFSECGEIISVNVINTGSYAFVNFKHPSSAMAAIRRFNGYSIAGDKFLTVRYAKAPNKKGNYGDTNAQQLMSDAPLRPWANNLQPNRTNNGAYHSYENRNLMHTASKLSEGYRSFKEPCILPQKPIGESQNGVVLAQTAIFAAQPKDQEPLPANLPIKPRFPLTIPAQSGSPSAVSKPQPNGAQAVLRTPDKNQHCSSAWRTSASGRRGGVERSVWNSSRRSFGSDNPKTPRKSPKKQKILPNNHKIRTPGVSNGALKSRSEENAQTESPAEKLSPSSVGMTSEESEENTERTAALYLTSITSPVLNTKPMTKTSVIGSSIVDETALQQQNISKHCRQYTQVESNNANLDAKSDSTLCINPLRSACSLQPGLCGDTALPTTLISETLRIEALDINTLMLNRSEESFMNPEETSPNIELAQQQKKKKSKNRRKTLNHSFGSTVVVVTGRDDPPMQENGLKPDTSIRPDGQVKAESESSSNAAQQAVVSTPAQPTEEKSKNRTISPERNAKNDFSSQGDPGRQSYRPKRPTRSSQSDCNDIFQDSESTPVEHMQEINRRIHGSINTIGSAQSSNSDSDISSEAPRSNDVGENQTPTRKPQTRQHKNIFDSRASIQNRKENKKLVLSPVEILSDPSNWPALGSTKSQITTQAGTVQTSAGKPLGERPLVPGPIRRNSMASVVAQPPQPIRRLTIDSSNSPVSGGSPLWPVVKRWDSHGKDCTPSSRSTQE